MNFYESLVKYSKSEMELPFGGPTKSLFPSEDEDKEKRFYQEVTRDINDELGIHCDSESAFSVFIWDTRAGEMKIIFAVDTDKATMEDCKKYIESYFYENFDVGEISFSSVTEITTARFHQLGEKGDNNNFIKRFRGVECDLGIDYRDNCQYKLNEVVIKDEPITLEKIKEEAEAIMADESLLEEFDRIFSDENEKKYYGNPVHYKISASSKDSAMDIINLLAKALKANNRLVGGRMNSIYDVKTGCYDEKDFQNIFELSHGNIVILDLSGTDEDHGNYASSYEDVMAYINELVKQNHVKTLCIFIENLKHPGFANHLLARVAEDIDIIEIKEGNGSKEQAITFIERLAKDSMYTIDKSEIEAVMPDKVLFTVGEAYAIYNNWFKNGLRERIYKAYSKCACMEIKKDDKKSEPYDELQKMVGLNDIKQVVDEIIDSARVQKLRSEMGMDSYKTSLHMVFTGNPGSAKTTVARLIAQILAKEGILKTGKYVECGRADLVGRYVGWTAKAVCSKFRDASGGVLFIDEAYSLVDGSNSFGDEAINTIVQEMENHRDDVIVIFAGYPDKMQEFLNKNEGLRSRIAFHLDFPDYNAEELVEILKLMADNKGYKLNSSIEKRCLDIFKLAVKQEEFGNGRYARNLLEQAMMAQSRRITKEYKGKKVTRKALTTLKVEDFEVNASKQLVKAEKQGIGFAV